MKTSSNLQSSARPVEALDYAEMRDLKITVAAYHRAEARGFSPGYEMDDWLEAEAEVDRATNV